VEAEEIGDKYGDDVDLVIWEYFCTDWKVERKIKHHKPGHLPEPWCKAHISGANGLALLANGDKF